MIYHFLQEPLKQAPQVPFVQSRKHIDSSNPQEEPIESTLPDPCIGVIISSRVSKSDI